MRRPSEYQKRKQAGRCVYPNCPNLAGSENVHCDQHAIASRQRAKQSRRKRRSALEAGKCYRCGRRSGTYRCVACAVAEGRLPTVGVHNGVHKREQVWRVDPGTNWSRYRGRARRGKPATSLLDRQDLDYAIKEIALSRDALLMARAQFGSDRRNREDVIKAALHRLDLAERWIDEVRDRYRKYTSGHNDGSIE